MLEVTGEQAKQLLGEPLPMRLWNMAWIASAAYGFARRAENDAIVTERVLDCEILAWRATPRETIEAFDGAVDRDRSG